MAIKVTLVEFKDIIDLSNHSFENGIDVSIKPSVYHAFKSNYDKIIEYKKGIYQCQTTSGFQDCKVGILYSPTIRASNPYCSVLIEDKIVLLNELEQWEFMGFDKESFLKAKVIVKAKSQLSRAAGNSIVVNVLEKIFEDMLC